MLFDSWPLGTGRISIGIAIVGTREAATRFPHWTGRLHFDCCWSVMAAAFAKTFFLVLSLFYFSIQLIKFSRGDTNVELN